MIYKMQFLEPKDDKEREIYELLTLIVNQTEVALSALSKYKTSVINKLNADLTDMSPKRECSNYPLLDEAETEDVCHLEIHHFSPNDVLSIVRNMRRAESDYSGKELNDIKKNHRDQKWTSNLMRIVEDTSRTTALDYIKNIQVLYYDYMLRMGYATGMENPLPYISKSFDQLIERIGAWDSPEEGQETKIVFCDRYFRQSRINKMICIVYAKDLGAVTSAFHSTGAPVEITKDLVFFFRSMKDFDADMETFHVTTDGYSIVSTSFNGRIGVQSIFDYNPYNFTFEQVDPITYIKKYVVTLYGVESVQINPATGALDSLLKVPGFEDEYFSVLAPCNIQTRVEDDYTTTVKMLISDKVIVDGFRIVDAHGLELSKEEACVVDSNVVKYGTHTNGEEMKLMVSVTPWNVTIMAKKNCFLKIICHSAKPMNTPFASMDQTTNLILKVCKNHATSPSISYDDLENPVHDRITPMITEINIPFAKNIKQVELIPEWAYCGRLDDLMKLYVVDHVSCLDPKKVKKTLINYNIKNVSLVQVGKHDEVQEITVNHGVGWLPEHKAPNDPCISLTHRGQWFLHIDLADPIPVLTCRGIQFSLMKNSIRVVSNYGVSNAEPQDVYYHVYPFPKPVMRGSRTFIEYDVKVTGEHPNDIPIVLDEKSVDFVIKKSIIREHIFSKKYTFRMEPVVRNSTKQNYDFLNFRSYAGSDAIRVYYKKTNDIGLPTMYSLPTGFRFVDGGLEVDLDTENKIPKDELKDYSFYVFVRYLVLKNTDTDERWLVRNMKVRFEMTEKIKKEA